MSRLRTALVIVALAVVASACGGTAANEAASGDLDAVAAPAPDAADAPLVPELTGEFATIGGGQIDLGSLEGQDVVLWFWAPW